MDDQVDNIPFWSETLPSKAINISLISEDFTSVINNKNNANNYQSKIILTQVSQCYIMGGLCASVPDHQKWKLGIISDISVHCASPIHQEKWQNHIIHGRQYKNRFNVDGQSCTMQWVKCSLRRHPFAINCIASKISEAGPTPPLWFKDGASNISIEGWWHFSILPWLVSKKL